MSPDRRCLLLLPSLALDQMLGTGLLVVIVLAATDGRNMKLEAGLVPLTIGLGLTAIHLRHHLVTPGLQLSCVKTFHSTHV